MYQGNSRIISTGKPEVEILDVSKTPIKRIYSNNSISFIISICTLPTEQIAAGGQFGDIYILEATTIVANTINIGTGGIYSLLWVNISDSLETPKEIYIY